MVGEHGLPGALGMERTAIEQSSRGSLGIRSRQKIQLLLRPVILAGKQQKLEQERAALGVEWVGPQLFAKRRDRLPQLPFAVKRKWCHGSSGILIFRQVVLPRPCCLLVPACILGAVLILDGA